MVAFLRGEMFDARFSQPFGLGFPEVRDCFWPGEDYRPVLALGPAFWHQVFSKTGLDTPLGKFELRRFGRSISDKVDSKFDSDSDRDMFAAWPKSGHDVEPTQEHKYISATA